MQGCVNAVSSKTHAQRQRGGGGEGKGEGKRG